MNVEQLREYCLGKPYCFESFPFGDDSLVMKVGFDSDKNWKMFALIPLDTPYYIALKCDPEKALLLRDKYPEIDAAYHFNKKHWNSVRTDGNLDHDMIRQMIDDSYELALASLPKRVRDALKR